MDNLRPVLGEGIGPVLKGIKVTALSFQVLKSFDPDAFHESASQGHSYDHDRDRHPFAFYMITVVMVIGALSIDGVVSRTWPTIDLMRSFEIPGLIFERFESLLLVIWIMQLFCTFAIAFMVRH
ncbi:GerAB/ArcD/ProY family transporter [Bacillus licheniformis]|nr:GerAB/ArcD/ProY family transporter [Bacillus licheniformis]